jgi:prolyl 4-hydroxylase
MIDVDIIKAEPKIFIFKNLYTPEECDAILNSGITFEPALGYDGTTKKSIQSEWRTCHTHYDRENRFGLTDRNYKVVKPFFWFLDEFTTENLEEPQIQRYDVGQEFKPHEDFFTHPGIHEDPNDRIATLIVYLNDDFEGGETYFTKLDIRIVPKQGAALFFDYKYIFDLNMKTQHAGLPIISGQKWIATSWIRGRRYNSSEDPNNRL